jgi:hypothetical protein
VLANPIYIDEIRHKKVRHPGQHKSIVDRQAWEEVQKRLRDQTARDGRVAAIASREGVSDRYVVRLIRLAFLAPKNRRGDRRACARSQDVAKELFALGGALVILATAPDGKAMGSLIDGLGVDGRLMIVGASVEPFAVSSFQLLFARKSLMDWPAGTSIDSEDTLRFAAAMACNR